MMLQLISIAHRLQTVAYYDRVLVLDAGQVAEVCVNPLHICVQVALMLCYYSLTHHLRCLIPLTPCSGVCVRRK